MTMPRSRGRALGAGGLLASDGTERQRTGGRHGTVLFVALRMPAVWTDRHRLHAPGCGVWLGVTSPGDEEPDRGDALRDSLDAAGAVRHGATAHGDAPVLAVHNPEMVEFLSRAHADWVAAGPLDDPGQPLVVPYVFALAQLTHGRSAPRPTAIRAEVGLYAMDTMTPIGSGTYEAARAAAACAPTAADLVIAGAPAAYAAVRPPGHHAGPSFYGGSCYLNNAAIAAQHLRDSGAARVAIIDIDAHHGNGTQEVFWERADVWFGSVHVDPGAGWFPHFVGFAGERGAGDGAGTTFNAALPPGAGDDEWVRAVRSLASDAGGHRPEALVVSLGVDAAEGDPESPLRVTRSAYHEAGSSLAGVGVPTVFVQEGGYDIVALGDLVLAVLEGFESRS